MNHKALKIIEEMKSQFFDANCALNLFDNSFDENWIQVEAQRSFRNLKNRLSREFVISLADLSKEINETVGLPNLDSFEEELKSKYNNPFVHNAMLIHAKAFIIAFSTFRKLLSQLKFHIPNINDIENIENNFDSFFPTIAWIRNSTSHPEQRIHAEKQYQKKIKLKPVNTPPFKIHSGAMINAFLGKTFTCTLENGNLGEIDITLYSLEKLANIFLHVLNSYTWTGPQQIYPTEFPRM